VQTIHEAALKTASQLTWRISGVIGALFAVAAAFFIMWSTYFRVETGVTAISEQISHLILVGDTFQLKTELLSLASSGIIDYFFLKEPSGIILAGNTTQEVSQFEGSSFSGNQVHIGRVDGSIQVIRKFAIRSAGAGDSILIVSKRLPVEVFLLTVSAMILFFLFTHQVFRRLIMNLAGDLTDPISDLSRVVSETQSYNGLAENRYLKSKLRYQELDLTLNSFLKLLFRLKTAEEQRVVAEKEAALTQIATQVAHDIRAPLAALKVALAQYKESGPKESSELMSSAITRIAGIADDLLLNDTQIDKDNFEYFHASQAIESIFDEKKLTSSGCEFNLVIGAEFVVFGSKPYFQRAVSNFINNSVEAKKNGTLRISALVDRNSIIIEDDGKGMAHEAVQNLLRDNDNNVTTKTYGFGLGFKGARSLLQKMSLSVEVQSSLGHGTKVIISKNKT
jgi:signal transduction histidine kinase